MVDQVVGVVGLALGGGTEDGSDQAAGAGFAQSHEYQPGPRAEAALDAAQPGPVAPMVGDGQAPVATEGDRAPAAIMHSGCGPASTSNSRLNWPTPMRRRRSRSAFPTAAALWLYIRP